MLSHRLAAPPGASDGAAVFVLLHGRGADESDLLPLGSALGENVVVVCPRAPFDAAPWGYGAGYAWYRYLGDDRPEPESFTASADALAAFLEALPAELPLRPGKLLLGGFSQGGTTALGTTLARGLRVDGVVVMSGFLPSHPEVDPARAKGLPVFWGHGTHDPAIPHALGERGRSRLQAAGALLETRDYRMGHAIHPAELDDLRRWAGAVGE